LDVGDDLAGDRSEDPATERDRRYLFAGDEAQHEVADGQVENEDVDAPVSQLGSTGDRQHDDHVAEQYQQHQQQQQAV